MGAKRRLLPLNDFTAALGARLRLRRRELGLPLRQVSDRTGLGITAICMYECGRREPGAGRLLRLSRALGVSIDWIVTGKDPAVPD